MGLSIKCLHGCKETITGLWIYKWIYWIAPSQQIQLELWVKSQNDNPFPAQKMISLDDFWGSGTIYPHAHPQVIYCVKFYQFQFFLQEICTERLTHWFLHTPLFTGVIIIYVRSGVKFSVQTLFTLPCPSNRFCRAV
mgnify:CR=1 FL=1